MVFLGVLLYLVVVLIGLSLKKNAQKYSATVQVQSLPKVEGDPDYKDRCTYMENYTVFSSVLYCNQIPIDIRYPHAM